MTDKFGRTNFYISHFHVLLEIQKALSLPALRRSFSVHLEELKHDLKNVKYVLQVIPASKQIINKKCKPLAA